MVLQPFGGSPTSTMLFEYFHFFPFSILYSTYLRINLIRDKYYVLNTLSRKFKRVSFIFEIIITVSLFSIIDLKKD